MILVVMLLLVGCGTTKVLKNDEMIIVGHRGAMGYVPEHTLESFRLANGMGADYLELDVQMTKDGELVVFHDTVVDRTTNGTGELKDMTLAELKKLDAGSWFNEENPDKSKEEYKGVKIPTVREIFEEFGNSVNYYIETKSPNLYPGVEEKLIDLLNEYGLLEKERQVILHSASKESLLKLQKLAPDTEIGVLYWYEDKADITQSELNEIKDYVSHIVVNHNFLTVDYIQKVKEAGFSVYVYTVNDVDIAEKLKIWGVDGIITDFPDLLD